MIPGIPSEMRVVGIPHDDPDWDVVGDVPEIPAWAVPPRGEQPHHTARYRQCPCGVAWRGDDDCWMCGSVS